MPKLAGAIARPHGEFSWPCPSIPPSRFPDEVVDVYEPAALARRLVLRVLVLRRVRDEDTVADHLHVERGEAALCRDGSLKPVFGRSLKLLSNTSILLLWKSAANSSGPLGAVAIARPL